MINDTCKSIFNFLPRIPSKEVVTGDQAYQFGYESQTKGPTIENCHYSIFNTEYNMHQWDRGRIDGVLIKDIETALRGKENVTIAICLTNAIKANKEAEINKAPEILREIREMICGSPSRMEKILGINLSHKILTYGL